MDSLKKIGGLIACCILSICLFAQNNSTAEEPTDFMRSNGKIYVVVAVIVTIVTGIFIYLLNLDRKIGRLEKEEPVKQKPEAD